MTQSRLATDVVSNASCDELHHASYGCAGESFWYRQSYDDDVHSYGQSKTARCPPRISAGASGGNRKYCADDSWAKYRAGKALPAIDAEIWRAQRARTNPVVAHDDLWYCSNVTSPLTKSKILSGQQRRSHFTRGILTTEEELVSRF